MDLAARRSARQHNDFVMRLEAVLVSVALLDSLVFQPPKAKAVLLEGTLITVAAAFLASCGLSWVVSGLDTSGFENAVGGLLQDYLDTEFAGQTPLEWAGDVAVIATGQWKLQIPAILARKVAAFANWVVGEYGVTAGGEAVEVGSVDAVTLLDGLIHIAGIPIYLEHAGIPESVRYRFSDSVFPVSQSVEIYINFGSWCSMTNNFPALSAYLTSLYLGGVTGSLALGATAIDVPDTGTMADDDAWEIGVGALGGVALDVLLQQILDAILAGNLAATGEIVQAGEITRPGEITDVDELGLPALGAALTSRFPFSIPWDVVRGIKLLAAPAEAPYWKVDFMAPISDRVGGWKGDTSIEIDMGEYPIIGQVCRWTSTIGFCLLLASGTKKLIWTA